MEWKQHLHSRPPPHEQLRRSIPVFTPARLLEEHVTFAPWTLYQTTTQPSCEAGPLAFPASLLQSYGCPNIHLGWQLHIITTIKANGIKYRKIVLLRTKFVLNQWSIVITAKASMLYIFHLCTAPWQFVKSLWKCLARTLPALEDLCRLLFQFFMFPQRLTPFAGTNKCTADCTKLFHSLETL